MTTSRWILVALWALGLIAFTVASGFTLPPTEGVADPDQAQGLGAAQLSQLLSTTLGETDTYSLSPGLVVHGSSELLVLAGPERAPYAGEAEAMDTFLEDGGTLLLFTTSEVWNPYLTTHGVTVHGQLLLPTSNATAERLVELTLPDDLGGGTLLMPNATAITDPGPEVRTVTPDQDLVLDIDGNGTIEVPPDRAGAFPVLASEPVGDGQLIVITSIEAVLGPGIDRNLDSLTRLIQATGAQGPAALDSGTHPRGWSDAIRAPAQASLSLAHWSPIGAGLMGLATAGLVLLLPARPGSAERDGPDDLTEATLEVMNRGRR